MSETFKIGQEVWSVSRKERLTIHMLGTKAAYCLDENQEGYLLPLSDLRMKNKILKAFYNQACDLANKFIKRFDGRTEQMTINVVMRGFLKFIHDELEIS